MTEKLTLKQKAAELHGIGTKLIEFGELMQEIAKELFDYASCDCIASGNQAKPKQHGADPHAKNCSVYRTSWPTYYSEHSEGVRDMEPPGK